MKILVLALSGIGDALMFTPALRLMRKALPDAMIDALVMYSGVRDIYERNPDLNKVIHFDFMKKGIARSLLFTAGLRGKYDASVNVYPSNRKEYNAINFLIGAKKRGGIEYLRMNKKNWGYLNNVRVSEDDSLHNVNENINLVKKLFNISSDEEPPLQFHLTEEDRTFANDYFKKINITESDTIIGFHPGCSTLKNHEKRRWAPEKFAELARNFLDDRIAAKILIFGGPEEEKLKQEIADAAGRESAIALSTKNLAQTAALIERCSIFVSNDSSLMHVAAAMKRKTVAVIGPTNTAYIHPWKTEYAIASTGIECAPCFIYSPRPLICFRDDVKFKCVKELSVQLVYDRTIELLKV